MLPDIEIVPARVEKPTFAEMILKLRIKSGNDVDALKTMAQNNNSNLAKRLLKVLDETYF